MTPADVLQKITTALEDNGIAVFGIKDMHRTEFDGDSVTMMRKPFPEGEAYYVTVEVAVSLNAKA